MIKEQATFIGSPCWYFVHRFIKQKKKGRFCEPSLLCGLLIPCRNSQANIAEQYENFGRETAAHRCYGSL